MRLPVLPVLPVWRNLMACRQQPLRLAINMDQIFAKGVQAKNTMLSSRDPHYSLKENVKQKIQRSKPKTRSLCYVNYLFFPLILEKKTNV